MKSIILSNINVLEETKSSIEALHYEACPVCNDDEFLIAEHGQTLICMSCGPINLTPHAYNKHVTTQKHTTFRH